jgi:hypothetical protein
MLRIIFKSFFLLYKNNLIEYMRGGDEKRSGLFKQNLR